MVGIVSAQANGAEDGSTASAAFFTAEVVVSVVAEEVSMAVAADGVAAVMAAAVVAVVIVEVAGPMAKLGLGSGCMFQYKTEWR